MNQQLTAVWSYHVVECSEIKDVEASLSENGQQGWELVNVLFEPTSNPTLTYKTNRPRHHGVWRLFFKRSA
ncbi:MAG: hypothetical protein NXI22_22525 [bacterium]|nr:hypothetical protein [bacterium]